MAWPGFFQEEAPEGLTIAQKTVARALTKNKRELAKKCRHEQYEFMKHGRCCPTCSTIMTDIGD